MTERHGKAWSGTEERRLTEAFRAGATLDELAVTHQRSLGALRIRLERLGLVEGASDADRKLPPASIREPLESDDASLAASIDHLIITLQTLKTDVLGGRLSEQKVTAVTSAYELFDANVLSTVHSTRSHEDVCHDDPFPERLREALRNLVRVCIPKLKDRYVAVRVLGLSDDGLPATLATIGEELGVSRERVRQRRVRAFRRIDSTMARRVRSAAALRAVLQSASDVTDWSDPEQVAPCVVRYISDHFEAARQLTVMCCKAAGSWDSRNRELAQSAALRACKDPEILGKWRLDRWADAVGATIGSLVRFEAPPIDLVGRKRTPAMPTRLAAAEFSSEKLGRDVACGSGTEYRVFNWLEKSPEVSWYQEQPVAVPYRFNGRDRTYYPDVAVWDRQGRVVVVEIKPIFTMYREDTIVKATAAWSHFAPRGIGYLMVDASGRTIADLTFNSYDKNAAEEIESHFATGPVPFRKVRERLSRLSGRFDYSALVSMVVNRDLPRRVSVAPIMERLPIMGSALIAYKSMY